jgi:hypothetical protein
VVPKRQNRQNRRCGTISSDHHERDRRPVMV